MCCYWKYFQSTTHQLRGTTRINLGPLLFLLLINDLPNCLKHSTPGLFADDTNITIAGIDITVIENLLNEDLEQFRK